MFSHQVDRRKWAYDKRPVISTLYVILMDRFYLSHLSAAKTKDIFLEDGKLLVRGKKPNSDAFFCRLCQYTYDGLFQSARHMIFAHLLNPLSSAPRCTALHAPSCRKRGSHCNVTGSPNLRQNNLLTCACMTSLLLWLYFRSKTRRRHGDSSGGVNKTKSH